MKILDMIASLVSLVKVVELSLKSDEITNISSLIFKPSNLLLKKCSNVEEQSL